MKGSPVRVRASAPLKSPAKTGLFGLCPGRRTQSAVSNPCPYASSFESQASNVIRGQPSPEHLSALCRSVKLRKASEAGCRHLPWQSRCQPSLAGNAEGESSRVRAQSALPARLGSFRPSLDPESAPRPRLLTKRPGFLDRRHSEPKSSPQARQRFMRQSKRRGAESGAPQHRAPPPHSARRAFSVWRHSAARKLYGRLSARGSRIQLVDPGEPFGRPLSPDLAGAGDSCSIGDASSHSRWTRCPCPPRWRSS
jgi:hypothetical protein